jgi:hypothetical protein
MIAALAIAFRSTAVPQAVLIAEYLRDDVAGATQIGKLIPLDKQTVQGILAVVGRVKADQDEETGFGGRIFEVRRGHGYTSIIVRGFAVNGRLAWVKMGVEAYSPNWESIREQVMKSWKTSGGPVYACNENECFSEWTADEVLASYRQAVALQLGAPTEVRVSDILKKHYEYLMSPFETTLMDRALVDCRCRTSQ